jgi:hypothetical protein
MPGVKTISSRERHTKVRRDSDDEAYDWDT